MTTTSTPTAGPWHSGEAYEHYMGRWSRQLAPRFLAWLAAPPGQRWLDVGCGTGALAAAILELCAPAAAVGVEPSAGFLAAARDRLPARVVLHRAAADQLPLADASVDFAVAALVLNFVPDAGAALREMARVTVDGGCVAVCVWDYAGKMDLIRQYWEAAADLGLLVAGQDEAERFPLCHPDTLAAAFTGAGLRQVDVTGIKIQMELADFDDYWLPFLGGQGPAPAHATSLADADRQRLRELLRQRLPLTADRPELPFTLTARAWAARGRVAA